MPDVENAVVEGFDPTIFANVFQLSTNRETGLTTAFFFAFNTTITLSALAPEARCEAAFREISEECKRYERLFSRHIPESDIARLNAAWGDEVEIGVETYALLQASRHYCAMSGGVFDISVGPALQLWDFARGVIPEASELARSTSHIDWRMLQIRSEAEKEGYPPDEGLRSNALGGVDGRHGHSPRYYARLTDPEGVIDVGGIAKGYIADKLAARLDACSIQNYVINLGGNVVVKGRRPDGEHWKVGIQDPRRARPALRAIEVVDASAVTSGTCERSFTKNGVLYHHILDPKTGRPVDTDVAGVTVVAARSLDSEGYSTTLLALGIEKGCSLARERNEIIAAYFVDKEGVVTEA